MSVEPPETLDIDNLDQYSEAEIAAFNERQRERLEARLEERGVSMSDADVEALRLIQGKQQAYAAEKDRPTATVDFDGQPIEVYVEPPPKFETLYDEFVGLQASDAAGMKDIIRKVAEVLAALCAEDGYDNPDVWYWAYVDDDEVGMDWLWEAYETLSEPMEAALDEKNSQSSDSRVRNEGHPSTR